MSVVKTNERTARNHTSHRMHRQMCVLGHNRVEWINGWELGEYRKYKRLTGFGLVDLFAFLSGHTIEFI